jgi:hypothetical protein
MSKFLLTVCAFGLLLSSAFAEDRTPEQLRQERQHIFGIEGLENQTFSRIVASGTKQRIGFYASVNPDCSATGDINVRVTGWAAAWPLPNTRSTSSRANSRRLMRAALPFDSVRRSRCQEQCSDTG